MWFLISIFPLSFFFSFPQNVPEPAPAFPGFALVELFTSQGCSSCPPADRLLQELVQEAEKENLPVYGLSFHVDYWNRLGWKDPYSRAAYSQRQREYARRLPDRVYTPQMVINGRWGFVGSRNREARSFLEKALASPAPAKITLSARERTDVGIRLGYRLEGAWAGAELCIALVDGELSNAVPRGENAGRDLSHVRVVRDLIRIAPSVDGSLDLSLASLEKPEEGEAVAFLQETGSGRIIGASRLAL